MIAASCPPAPTFRGAWRAIRPAVRAIPTRRPRGSADQTAGLCRRSASDCRGAAAACGDRTTSWCLLAQARGRYRGEAPAADSRYGRVPSPADRGPRPEQRPARTPPPDQATTPARCPTTELAMASQPYEPERLPAAARYAFCGLHPRFGSKDRDVQVVWQKIGVTARHGSDLPGETEPCRRDQAPMPPPEMSAHNGCRDGQAPPATIGSDRFGCARPASAAGANSHTPRVPVGNNHPRSRRRWATVRAAV